MLTYRTLCASEIDRPLFRAFVRHQVVDQCLHREDGAWVVRSDPFVDDWSEEDYQFLTACLQNTIQTGGAVYEDMRRSGIGRTLFQMAAEWARTQGAAKLYISSHSAIETQRFYRSLGCVDAAQPQQKHVEAEPFDCQLEYRL